LRIVNLLLAKSVDEDVYKVLGERCDLFKTFVGAMQPVLSIARKMLLGAIPFNAAVLNDEVRRSKADQLSGAAFVSNATPPEGVGPPGVTIEDLTRAVSAVQPDLQVDTAFGRRRLGNSSSALAHDLLALPLGPFLPELKKLGQLSAAQGEVLPLVMESSEDQAFRVVVAAWAGPDGFEIVDRAERLEALLGVWDGKCISESQWRAAHSEVRRRAAALVASMRQRAEREEREALERQIGAASRRLIRELALFLACFREAKEEFNETFHRYMGHGGQTAALLIRAHGLVGYPDWTAWEVQSATAHVLGMTESQKKNLRLGSPLEAAVRDPRWAAREWLASGHKHNA
jgi:hypothetical protein